MKNTKNNNSTLNPEIKKKAVELFDLIEQECEDGHCDNTLENIAEEMGGLLQSHRGFEELLWAYRISCPKSKQTIWTLEESARYMEDETLGIMHQFPKSAKEAVDYFNEDEINVHAFEFRMQELEWLVPKVLRPITTELEYRCIHYGKEIKQLS